MKSVFTQAKSRSIPLSPCPSNVFRRLSLPFFVLLGDSGVPQGTKTEVKQNTVLKLGSRALGKTASLVLQTELSLMPQNRKKTASPWYARTSAERWLASNCCRSSANRRRLSVNRRRFTEPPPIPSGRP